MRWDTVREEKRGSISTPSRGSKKSYGLILCRRPDSTCPSYRAILIRGRCTYAFAEFVHGHYDRYNYSVARDLIQNMTMDERLTVRSLVFQEIWKKFWMTTDVDAQYVAKCQKFYETWIEPDQGMALRMLIDKTKGVGQIHWEFPKGRPFNAHEPELKCALREFKEETCIPDDSYQIVPNFRREDVYTHMGVQYHTVYFLAVQTGNLIDPQRCFSSRNQEQVAEVADIKWMTLAEMNHVEGPAGRKLREIAQPAFNKLRNLRRGASSFTIHVKVDIPNPIQIAKENAKIQMGGNTNEWITVTRGRKQVAT